jgi:hypothetical protein
VGNFIPGAQRTPQNVIVGTQRRRTGNQQYQRGEKKHRKQRNRYLAGLAKIGMHNSNVSKLQVIKKSA